MINIWRRSINMLLYNYEAPPWYAKHTATSGWYMQLTNVTTTTPPHTTKSMNMHNNLCFAVSWSAKQCECEVSRRYPQQMQSLWPFWNLACDPFEIWLLFIVVACYKTLSHLPDQLCECGTKHDLWYVSKSLGLFTTNIIVAAMRFLLGMYTLSFSTANLYDCKLFCAHIMIVVAITIYSYNSNDHICPKKLNQSMQQHACFYSRSLICAFIVH